MNSENIVRAIYEGLNQYSVEPLELYLADNVSIVTLYKDTPPIEGKEAVLKMFKHMLSIVENSSFTFLSKPAVMGAVVTVEYEHYYLLKGEPVRDHNVSLLIFNDNKVVKWAGYIHPK